jgi:hypothetical protein
MTMRRKVAAKAATIVVAIVVAILGVVAFALRPGGVLAGTEFAHAVAVVVSLDRLTLEVAPPLAPSRVDVIWHAYASPDGTAPSQVVSAGALAAPIPRVYGENDVEILYAGQRVDTIRQFKTAWWHYHAYSISLKPNEAGRPVAKLTAVGVDAVH